MAITSNGPRASAPRAAGQVGTIASPSAPVAPSEGSKGAGGPAAGAPVGSAPSGSVLRIVHATLGAGTDPFVAATQQGFSHLMIAPPWVSGPRGDAYLTADFVPASPDLDLAALCRQAGRAGLGVLLDVVIDRISATSPLLAAAGCPFAAATRDMILDPRRGEGADAAPATLGTTGDALALAAWWAKWLGGWVDQGISGFRLLGLDAVPPTLLPAFTGALRQALPQALLLAWTPGLPRSAWQGLRGLGLDGVFAVVSDWDWRSGSLWDDIDALSGVAPVLGVDGSAPGPHQTALAAEPRAQALAAMVGQGWLHVAGGTEPSGSAAAAMLNAALKAEPAFAARSRPRLPLGAGGDVLAVLRADGADHRIATRAVLAVINADAQRDQTVAGADLLPASGGVFQVFSEIAAEDAALSASTVLRLPAGGVRLFGASAYPAGAAAPKAAAEAARAAAAAPRLAIEMPSPAVDGGAFPVKAVAGELISVEADIVFDGHDKIAAALTWRDPDGHAHEVPMRPLGNDRWQAAFPLGMLGRHSYVVSAWRDRFETFRDELAKKSAAGVKIGLELVEGQAMVQAAAARSPAALQAALQQHLAAAKVGDDGAKVAALLSPEMAHLMKQADDRPFGVQTASIPVDAERIEARFASWYEVFPRSMSDDEARHGTFADVEKHLPRIAAMGFDVLYFPPISPIGSTNRKGRNNTLTPTPEDPGSPYAIGSADGGHDALHPQLGSLADFQHLRRTAQAHGIELAIDFAIQCSPDHPWLKQHPGWFDWRPDGTIRYAENPPKRYEDIVNVDFYAGDAVPGLWTALCDVVLFWAGEGVRLFRVDNPHTKPLPFWQWMIAEVRSRYPDAIFLAEAFTRPKVMYRLAKIGFSQSYTYFTWRNSKRELEEYLTELDTEPPRDFFRPHFFVNTPDINPPFLHDSGRPGFLIRAALAATLSGLWGVYNGFELCEAAAVPGKEEYLDSEKYQLRAWDWDRAGNIVEEITALNRMRRQNPALQTHRGVRFLSARNDAVLYYEKATPDRSNVVLVAVSLDPLQAQEADFDLPLWQWKLPDDASLSAQDLLTDAPLIWHGKTQHLRLTPERPYAAWRVRSST